MNTQQKQIQIQIAKIGMYADEHDYFNPDFIVNVKKQFNERKSLSEKQINAIKNIIEKCDIEKWFKKKFPDYEFNF